MTITTLPPAKSSLLVLPSIRVSRSYTSRRQQLKKPRRSHKPTCQRHDNSSTFGHIVEVAHGKNNQLLQHDRDSTPMHKLLLQHQTWTKLQDTFLCPNADTAAIAKRTVLTLSERHAICGCAYNRALDRLADLKVSFKPVDVHATRRVAKFQTPQGRVIRSTSSRSSHPLSCSVTVRSTCRL
eukprot:m.38720 g.38720  ORF g.38720 m.38720 type:complete len:182 (+) comp12611_c0_seq5:456-1001(+)